MALIPHCDRCDTRCAPTVVLGVDLCTKCVADVRAFVKTKPAPTRYAPKGLWFDRALEMIRTHGYASTRVLAEKHGGDPRRCYWSLLNVAKRGELEHAGSGIFKPGTGCMVVVTAAEEDRKSA